MTRIDKHMPKTGRTAPLASLEDIDGDDILDEALPEENGESGDPTFDALRKNELLIQDLQAKVDHWEEIARDNAKGGKPSKTVLAHLLGLTRLLTETVSNHTKMLLQREKAKTVAEQPENGRGSHTTVNVEVLSKIYSHLTDCDQETQDRTVNLLGKVKTRLMAAAERRPARKNAQLGTAEKSVE